MQNLLESWRRQLFDWRPSFVSICFCFGVLYWFPKRRWHMLANHILIETHLKSINHMMFVFFFFNLKVKHIVSKMHESRNVITDHSFFLMFGQNEAHMIDSFNQWLCLILCYMCQFYYLTGRSFIMSLTNQNNDSPRTFVLKFILTLWTYTYGKKHWLNN